MKIRNILTLLVVVFLVSCGGEDKAKPANKAKTVKKAAVKKTQEKKENSEITIKNAISHGSYSICGRENMNRMNIHYLAWKKRYDERIKRRTNKVLIDDIKKSQPRSHSQRSNKIVPSP